MNEYFSKISFSYEGKDEPRVDMTHYSIVDGMTIEEFYEVCKSFARAVGYVEGSIRKTFDHEYDY